VVSLIIQTLPDPPAALVTTIGQIALLDNTVISSTRQTIVTIGHQVTLDIIVSHQVTVANHIIGLIAKVTIKIGPPATSTGPANHKVINQVVTVLVLLVTIRIGPHLVVTTLVTGPLAAQIVTVTISRTASKILVTNTETGVVPLTVTEHKLILVTISLGKITPVKVNKIRVTTGL
jgi:hypothetical protein